MSASLSIHPSSLPIPPSLTSSLRCLCNVHLRFISVRPCRAYPPDMASDFRFALQRTRNQLSLRLTACPTYPPVCLSVCQSACLPSVCLSVCLPVCPSVSLVWPARREYLNCGIFVAFEVKVFAFDFGYKVDFNSLPSLISLAQRVTCSKTLPVSLSHFLR